MKSVTEECHQDLTGRVNKITQNFVWRVTPWNGVERGPEKSVAFIFRISNSSAIRTKLLVPIY
jgi:hypothetical protein